mmetsp:Transcript_60327/g.176336  ORF Transcript_60327/g.176336 Transcript_60327/m.176336 type:complete len:453 (+) Transcript_60327:1191-2549(+)
MHTPCPTRVLLQQERLQSLAVVLLDAEESVALVHPDVHGLQDVMDLLLHLVAVVEGIHWQLLRGILQPRREDQDDLGGRHLAQEEPLHYAVCMQGAPVYHSVGKGVPDQRLDERPAFHEEVPDRRVRHRHGAVDAAVAVGHVIDAPGADAQGVEGVVLQPSGDDQVVVGQQGAVVEHAAALLAVDLHEAAVQDPDAELQHDAPELLVRVGRRARDQRQVVRMVVLQAARSQQGQGPEAQVRDVEQALEEGEAAVARADDDDARVHWDLRLAEKLLGHDRERLRLRHVAQQLLPLLLTQVVLRGHLLLHVDEGGDLRRLAADLLQLGRAPRRHLQHLSEDGGHGAVQLRLHEEHSAATEPHSALHQLAGVLLEERVDGPVQQVGVPLGLQLLVVLDQEVVVQVVAAAQRVHGVRRRHLQHDEAHRLLVELGHEDVLDPLLLALLLLQELLGNS